MKPLSIVAFFDGRLGHEKQTRSILNALSGLTPIDIDTIKVSVASSAFFKNWMSYLLPILQRDKQGGILHPVDLIIGTGTHTHIPMLTRKKLQCKSQEEQVRVITCMTPDVLLRNKFDLCCIPMHDEPAAEDNIFVTQGPPSPVMFEKRHKPDRGLILVGGVDTKSHIWKSEEVAAQIRTIIAENPTMQWTVSSSPRTPEDICEKLEEMAASVPQLTFYRSKDTPAGWVEDQYACNGTVWVTADSVSMVYEALTAGCSVGVLPVEWLRQENKFNKSLNFLTEKKMIVDFTAWQQGTPMPTLKDEQLNESLRCAREILRRWWPDRL
ncbi:MAG: mitochondrial fission ELM1 family protein [Desulfobulbaceae bacterium]|nr:mitochondrial fission ELM1 family protein [Desulfobulbaceae bacterium]